MYGFPQHADGLGQPLVGLVASTVKNNSEVTRSSMTE